MCIGAWSKHHQGVTECGCYIWLPWSRSLTTPCLSMLYLVIFGYPGRVHLQLLVPRCSIWLPWSCSLTTACPSMLYLVTLVVFTYNCLSLDVIFGYPGRVHLQLLVPRCYIWLPWSCSRTTACPSMLYLVTLVVFTYNCLSPDVHAHSSIHPPSKNTHHLTNTHCFKLWPHTWKYYALGPL
jgi:hypothetical protein